MTPMITRNTTVPTKKSQQPPDLRYFKRAQN